MTPCQCGQCKEGYRDCNLVKLENRIIDIRTAVADFVLSGGASIQRDVEEFQQHKADEKRLVELLRITELPDGLGGYDYWKFRTPKKKGGE